MTSKGSHMNSDSSQRNAYQRKAANYFQTLKWMYIPVPW